MKLSTTTADLNGFTDNMAEQLLLFKDTGFKYFDLSLYDINFAGSAFIARGDGWKKEIYDLGNAAAKQGFTFVTCHSPSGSYFNGEEERNNLILSTKRSIEACGMLGIKSTVVHNFAAPSGTVEDFFKENKIFNSLFFEDMEKYDVNVLAENGSAVHAPTYCLRNGKEHREYIEFVGNPKLFACWDTGHNHLNKTNDQYECITALSELLKSVHIADNHGINDDHICPYFGNLNFAPVIQALLDIGYKGTFNFESSLTVFDAQSWPYSRKEWEYNGKTDIRLDKVPLHIKKQSVALCYEIGKYMLEQYGCFEE